MEKTLKNEIEEIKIEFEEITGFEAERFSGFFDLIASLIQQEREKAVREFVDFIYNNEPKDGRRALNFLEQFLKESTNVQE